MLAGLLSGVATACLTTPLDCLKIQAQTNLPPSHGKFFSTPIAPLVRCTQQTKSLSPSSSPLSSSFSLYQRAGVFQYQKLFLSARRLYTGHVMNMMREGVFTAIYLGCYAAVRETLLQLSCSLSDDPASNNHEDPSLLPAAYSTRQHEYQKLPLLYTVAASASIGCVAWIACYPFDSIKSLQQARFCIAREACSILLKRGGEGGFFTHKFGGFYRGLGASLFRAALVTSSRILVYEECKHLCYERRTR